MTLVLIIIVVGLTFDFINGFHDTANAVATSVGTKVLTPAQAILLAAVFNLVGALVGTAVAKTVGKGLVDTSLVTTHTVLFALFGAIIWNLLTWWFCLPSSSSHALMGGLCGAALATAHDNWAVIHWYEHTVVDPVTHQVTELGFFHAHGLWPKVIVPMLAAPVIGAIVGFLTMATLYIVLRNLRPRVVSVVFGKVQLLSAAWMSLTHGMNDAQKTMGVIALTLFTATQAHVMDHLPGWLEFLRTPTFEIALWIKVACALAIACGTAAGGKRIIKTLGGHMVKLQPVHGFAAQTTAAAVIETASHLGMPLSTTHVISSSIMGVGAARRLGGVRWTVAEKIVWAWVLTIPASAGMSYGFMKLAMALHLA